MVVVIYNNGKTDLKERDTIGEVMRDLSEADVDMTTITGMIRIPDTKKEPELNLEYCVACGAFGRCVEHKGEKYCLECFGSTAGC